MLCGLHWGSNRRLSSDALTAGPYRHLRETAVSGTLPENKRFIKKYTNFTCFSLFSRKLTDQLPPIIAAIDSSCKTAPRNIFSGAIFTLKCGYRRPFGAVGDFRRRFHEKGVKFMKTPIRRSRIITAITRR